MVRTVSCLAAGLLAAAVVAAPVPKGDSSNFISLKGHTNVKWDENLHSNRFENNNLKSLADRQTEVRRTSNSRSATG